MLTWIALFKIKIIISYWVIKQKIIISLIIIIKNTKYINTLSKSNLNLRINNKKLLIITKYKKKLVMNGIILNNNKFI